MLLFSVVTTSVALFDAGTSDGCVVFLAVVIDVVIDARSSLIDLTKEEDTAVLVDIHGL